AGARVVERHIRERVTHGARGARQRDTDRAPRAQDEARAIEAVGPLATPAVAVADLRGGEGDDVLCAGAGGGLPALAGALDQGGAGQAPRRGGGASRRGEGREGESEKRGAHGRIVAHGARSGEVSRPLGGVRRLARLCSALHTGI